MTTARRTVLACALGVGAIAAPLALDAPPLLLWNVTESAPVGLYLLRPAPTPSVGDWVAVDPPAPLRTWLDRRDYLRSGALLIKRVAALPPSLVCRSGVSVRIDGTLAAHALRVDSANRALPEWAGCRQLRGDEVFLLSAVPGSLDGRYFGPTTRRSVVGQAHLLWSRGAR